MESMEGAMEGPRPLWARASHRPEKPFSWNESPSPFLVIRRPGSSDPNDYCPRISLPRAVGDEVHRFGDLSLPTVLFGCVWGDWLGRIDSARLQAISSE